MVSKSFFNIDCFVLLFLQYRIGPNPKISINDVGRRVSIPEGKFNVES